jgi:hypothetical protein
MKVTFEFHFKNFVLDLSNNCLIRFYFCHLFNERNIFLVKALELNKTKKNTIRIFNFLLS